MAKRNLLAGQRALYLLRRMVLGASWYHSAIEIDTYARFDGVHNDGEKWEDEAKSILQDAGMDTERPRVDYSQIRKHLRPLPKALRGLDI